MKHNEYIRVSDNANVAVLMVHGIAGTPAHFRDLIPMIPEEWSVYNLRESLGSDPNDSRGVVCMQSSA